MRIPTTVRDRFDFNRAGLSLCANRARRVPTGATLQLSVGRLGWKDKLAIGRNFDL